MQRRREDNFVSRQILARAREIHQDVAVVQRVVDELDVFAQVEKFVGRIRLLQRPVVVVRVKDAGFGGHPGALERRRQNFQFLADLGDFVEHAAAALEIVRQDGAMEFFRAEPRLAPAEKQNGRRAARNQLVGEHPQHAGADQRVDVLPVDVAGLLLHHPEARVAVRACLMSFFFSERSMSISQAISDGLALMAAVLSMETKSSTFGQVEMVEAVAQRRGDWW